jgi:hypothetical protein
MRDEFPKWVVEMLAKRVCNRCSNPGCRKQTSGPHTEEDKALNVGVAAHITAASPEGPRYDPSLTPDERKGIGNGIWLCQSCGKLVDNDELRYTKEMLLSWKHEAEQQALREVESAATALNLNRSVRIVPHIGEPQRIDVGNCLRYGPPVVPTWLKTNPARMCSDWLVQRLLSNADLNLYFDPNWCDGIWLVADHESGDGVVINRDQLADLMPPSPTTTTPPGPQAPGER